MWYLHWWGPENRYKYRIMFSFQLTSAFGSSNRRTCQPSLSQRQVLHYFCLSCSWREKINFVLKSQLPTWHRRTGQDRELHQRVKALQRQDQPLASSPTCSPENEIYLAQSSSSLSHLACHLLINGRLCIKPKDRQENFWEFFKEKPDVGVRAQLDDYLQSHQHLARNTLEGYFTKKVFSLIL